MNDFRFRMATDIVFGKGAEEQVGNKVKEYGGTKVLLVYGGGSVKRSGLYEKVVARLREERVAFADLGGVHANPLLSLVRKGVQLARKEGADFLLALGGGSAIDTAKGISLGVPYEGDLWDLVIGKAVASRSLPIGVIHTIAAAGSETSRSFALVEDESRFKQGLIYNQCRPVFALMNPEWMYTLPKYQTAAGASDVFAHAFERYFHPGDCYIGDKFAEGVMRAVVKYTPVALEAPSDYEARAELMLAGSMAHNDILGIGRGDVGMEEGCHRLETPISASFDTAHGAGLAVIMPIWMEYTHNRADTKPYLKFAQNVFDVEKDYVNTERVVAEGIRRFRAWLKRIGMPSTLREMGLSEKSIGVLMPKIAPRGDEVIGTLCKLNSKDIERIYHSAL